MHELTIEGVGTFDVEDGTRLVRAIEEAGVDQQRFSDGLRGARFFAEPFYGRVEFADGEPDVMTTAEHDKLSDIKQLGSMRLSCQIVVDRDMTVKPLMTVGEQGWDDAGPEPAILVEPVPEWYPKEELDD